jgi:hypothetical protein
MYSHKLSNGHNFWLQLKNLLFKHPFAENHAYGIVSPQPALFPVKNNALQQAKALSERSFLKNAGKWRSDWEHFILADVDYARPANDEGFSNIKVHLNNKTEAPIDYIQVAVSTFEETGKLYKSEYAEVFNVGPLSSVNIPVYSSPKGKSMNVYITQVVSSAIDLQFSKNAYE